MHEQCITQDLYSKDVASRLAQECALSEALKHVAQCCERYGDALDHERDRADVIRTV